VNKKQKFLDLTKKEPLIDRQRRLWAHAEAIELAQQRGESLPADVSEWLHRALKNIAAGKDANEVFNVVPEKPGVRKDGFLRELQKKSPTVLSLLRPPNHRTALRKKRLQRRLRKSAKSCRIRKGLPSERTGISYQRTESQRSP
jgi:hypothetical protein